MGVSKAMMAWQAIDYLLAELVELVRCDANSFVSLEGSAIDLKLAIGNPSVGQKSSCP